MNLEYFSPVALAPRLNEEDCVYHTGISEFPGSGYFKEVHSRRV